MNIAIIGTGISGMLSARLLCREHRVSVFEAGAYIGGHTATKAVEFGGKTWNVDTGFIVFNEVAYPNFIQLVEKLNVPWQPADMSFSVSCERTGLEYKSTSLNTFFAQRRNLFRPSFWRMTRDIFRFFKEAREVLAPGYGAVTLGEYLAKKKYSREFLEFHILPLGAAIWSCDTKKMQECPAAFFVRFFENHGFMQASGRTPWRTLIGGSSQYIEPLVKPFRENIRLNSPVQTVRRFEDRVELTLPGGETQEFDQVVIATHSDQALKLLGDSSATEREILGAIPYQANDVVLHTDASILPKRKLAWASWNYHILDPKDVEREGVPTVTYDMNNLQSLKNVPGTFCVTLNRTGGIDPAKILRRYTYDHPLFTPASVGAQARHAEISGVRRTHFCGAYWGYGFHEDGVRSALAVAKWFGKSMADL